MRYNETVLEHFENPRNIGEPENYTAGGEAGKEEGQGNFIKIFLTVDGLGLIRKASFLTYGCPAIIASGSLLTEWITQKNIHHVSDINPDDLLELLGGLPLGKEHCATLAITALQKALTKVPFDRASCGEMCLRFVGDHLDLTLPERGDAVSLYDLKEAFGESDLCVQPVGMTLEEIQDIVNSRSSFILYLSDNHFVVLYEEEGEKRIYDPAVGIVKPEDIENRYRDRCLYVGDPMIESTGVPEEELKKAVGWKIGPGPGGPGGPGGMGCECDNSCCIPKYKCSPCKSK
jgi:nitrogen fixation NifU-like protein